VSIAVTNSACSHVSGAGTLENGHVRNAVHSPDTNSNTRTSRADNGAAQRRCRR
jgi:hypothetical protein